MVSVAACAAYASTLSSYFLNDDFGVVALLSSKPATYFPRWFVSSWMDTIWGFNPDEIRPFPAVSYQLTALAGAGSPVGHHLLNVLVHAANGVLVLAIARVGVGLRVWPAALAALIFVLLPVQTESVAWVTGRVDSLPALFYLGSLLAWIAWRTGRGAGAMYWLSFGLGFAALFSKQNTITLVAALLLYDVIVERRWPRPSWSWLRPYLPFALITLGYLYLRLVLFDQVVRERLLTAEHMAYAMGVIERHAWRVMLGHASRPSAIESAILVALAAVAVWSGARAGGIGRSGGVLYFVASWWLLGVAPVLMAGYESPRHVYLASMAWAMVAGLAAEAAWSWARSRTAQVILALVMVALLGRYVQQLSASIADWNGRARVSSLATEDVAREALAAPEGTLLIVGSLGSTWEWALPFVAQPPFAPEDLTRRVYIISPRLLHCCLRQWPDDTRREIAAWRARSDAPPVIALRWDDRSGALLRTTDAETPDLRSLAGYLAELPSGDDMDRILTDALLRLVVTPSPPRSRWPSESASPPR